MHKKPRRAFTLVELLVVIAIIGIMVALLLPAVLSAREAARRMQCANNMLQLVVAAHNYEMSHRVFPPGVVNNTAPVLTQPSGYHQSWIVQLLPYMEESNAFRQVDFKVGVYAPPNSTVRAHHIVIVECPSSSGFLGWSRSLACGTSNYAGVCGDQAVPINTTNHGTMYVNSFLPVDKITDGLSYTLLLGEKIVDVTDLGWMSGTRATLRNAGTPINVTGFTAQRHVIIEQKELSMSAQTRKLKDPKYVGGFGSEHVDGCQFALADGSIRFLCETLDATVFHQLANRADGQMINSDAF